MHTRAATAADAAVLRAFRCATAAPFEAEVERYVQERALYVALTAGPNADERLLLIEAEDQLLGVIGHRAMEPSIYLEGSDGQEVAARYVVVIAVALDWQGRELPGYGRLSDLCLDALVSDFELRDAPPVLSARIHQGNTRSLKTLARLGEPLLLPADADGYLVAVVKWR